MMAGAVPPVALPAPLRGGALWTGGVTAIACLIGGHLPATAVLALAVISGLPHGAFDYDLARRRFGGWAGQWWLPFLGGYLALLIATLAIWWIAPVVALLGFFILSAAHFGAQDAGPGPKRLLRVIAHGGVPIVLPALCHPAAFTRIVAILIGSDAAIIQRILAGPFAGLWLIAAITAMAHYASSGRAASRDRAVDLVLIGALFAWVTPLVAFAVYFALIHTPRAFADLQETARDSKAAWRAALLTGVALLLAAVILITGDTGSVSDDVVHAAFVLLSALTVPHMWLEFVSSRESTGPAPALFVDRLA